MRIREDKRLTELSNRCSKDKSTLSKEIINELVSREIIEDLPDNWGYSIGCSLIRYTSQEEIEDILNKVGINEVNDQDIRNLMALILMGDYNCPVCGGRLIVDYSEERICGGDGYLTPYEVEETYSEGHCTNCEYKF